MLPSLRRRKCLIGAALVAEIVLFSAVTFVIAYVNSLNAIHHASQQLADSMVDTVAVRVTGYMSVTEQSVHNLAVIWRDAMLPEDYGAAAARSGGPEWSTEWVLSLRTFMLSMNYNIFAIGMMFDDASLVSESMWDSLLLEKLIDARTLPLLGYRIARVSLRPPDTAPDASTTPVVQWPEEHDTYGRHIPGYYMVKELYGTNTSWCAWTPVFLDSDRGKETSNLACNVVNASGAYVGALGAMLDMGEFTEFLQQTAVTPSTAIFIYDETLFLIAATTPTPTSVIYPANATVVLRPGCGTSTIYSNVTAIRVGCRASVHDYPYEPLRNLASSDVDLLQSSTRRSAYRQLTDSMAYYVVCLPIARSGAQQSMRLVLFLPESDVLANVQQGFVLAIAMCVVLCLVGSLLSSFLVATLIGVPAKLNLPSRPAAFRSTKRRRSKEYRDDVRGMMRAYTDLLAACRRLDQGSAPREPGDAVSAAVQRYFEGTTPLQQSNESTQSANSGEVLDAPQRAVLLLMSQGESSRGSSVPRANLAAVDVPLRRAVEEHGGRIVDVVAASASHCAILWRIGDAADARGDTDHPELRAVLCGLALLRLRCASAAAVVRGDVLRYHSDPFRHGTLLQDAEALLSVARDGASAGLVASDAVLRRCPSDVFTLRRESDGRSGEIMGVAVPNGDGTPIHDGNTVRGPVLKRRVHFAEGAVSALALLRRAQHDQHHPVMDDGGIGPNTSGTSS